MQIPFLGLSFLISITIIIISFIFKVLISLFPNFLKKNTFFSRHKSFKIIGSYAIIIFVLTMSFNTYFQTFHTATTNEYNNLLLINNYIIGCKPIAEKPLQEKLVVLRLDDVQANSWNDVNIKMMTDAISHNMPIVAGIIPKNIHNDYKMTSFLNKHKCNIEIAIHGYTHHIDDNQSHPQTGEFSNLNIAEAREKLEAGRNELISISKSSIVTFIPPQNEISDKASGVLPEFGITYLSSKGDNVYDFDTSTWNNKTAESAINDCVDRFTLGDKLCVIMLHPQDFSTSDMQIDKEKYKEYTKLLDLLEEIPVSVVRFNEITPGSLDDIEIHEETKK